MKKIFIGFILLLAVSLLLVNSTIRVATAASSVEALNKAASSGNVESVRNLVEKGADVNARDHRGNTALMYAAEKGSMDIVQYLMQSGADINFGDFYGATALMFAKEHKQTDIIKLLEEETKNRELLIEGSKNGDLEKVKESVEKLVNINFQDDDGNTPLILASKENHIDVVKCLVENGADLNIKNRVEYTALMYAVQNGSTDIVELIINAGAEEDSFQKNIEKIIKANNFYGYKGKIEMYISYYRSDYSVFGDSGKNNVGKIYEGYLEAILDEGNQKIIFYENDYVKELILENNNNNNNNLIFYDKKKIYDSKQNSEDDFNNLKEKYPMHKYPESVVSFLYYDSFPQYFINTDVFLSSFLEGYLEHDRDYWYDMESELELNDDGGVTSFYVGDYSISYMWINNVPHEIELYTGAEVITVTFLDEKGWLRK